MIIEPVQVTAFRASNVGTVSTPTTVMSVAKVWRHQYCRVAVLVLEGGCQVVCAINTGMSSVLMSSTFLTSK